MSIGQRKNGSRTPSKNFYLTELHKVKDRLILVSLDGLRNPQSGKDRFYSRERILLLMGSDFICIFNT